MKQFSITVMTAVVLCWTTLTAWAETPGDTKEDPGRPDEDTLLLEPQVSRETVAGPVNMVVPTLGGKQLWADELLFHDWRIQRNVYTKHYRLLDDRNRRQAWGTFDHCRDRLEALKRQLDLPPMKPQAVIVLHGMWGTRSRMAALTDYLTEHGDFQVLSAAYPSTRGDLTMHAESFGRILQNLDGVEEVSVVAHSLGGLVVRRFLAELQNSDGEESLPRLKSVVMLGPPNNGAALAATFRGNVIFQTFWGPAGVQLGSDWEEMKPHLAVPPCPFGIIAGGCGNERGLNPILEGDNDRVIRVEETRLAGARDFLVLPVRHSAMMADEQVQQATLRFLQQGHFVSEEARQPIVETVASDLAKPVAETEIVEETPAAPLILRASPK